MSDKKDGRGKSLASLRNLPQYAGLADEEILQGLKSNTLATKVEERIKKLSEEYDLTDLKYHDRLLLERLFTLSIRLEEDEAALQTSIAEHALTPMDALKEEQRLSYMRNDFLKIQDSLMISRLRRKDTVEDNPVLLFQDIQTRARKFLEVRLGYVKCPTCNTVLCKVNFLYPDVDNKVILMCKRCDSRSEFTSQEIQEMERMNPYK